MAELKLKRFSTVEKYEEEKRNIENGDFFIINETEQLGTRCIDKNGVDKIFLTPANVLGDYTLPDGEVIITSNDTIRSAIRKLEQHIKNTDLNIENAITKSEEAYKALEDIKSLPVDESDAALSARISALESRDIIISEEEFAALEVAGKVDKDKIYYIYE